MRRLRGGAAAAAVLMCAMTVSGCTDQVTGSGAGARPGAGPGTGSGATAGGGAALAAARSLPVKGRAPKTGYDREKFGAAWADTDSNACDTRVISMLRGAIADFSQLIQGVVRYAY